LGEDWGGLVCGKGWVEVWVSVLEMVGIFFFFVWCQDFGCRCAGGAGAWVVTRCLAAEEVGFHPIRYHSPMDVL
jgi:hypothetical protein